MFLTIEVLLNVRIVQRVGNRAGTEACKRVPRHAAGDGRTGGRVVALHLAQCVQARRTDRITNSRLVEVAVVGDVDVVFVVQVAGIPVEVPVTDFERAFQAGGEAPGRQVGISGTRNFPATTAPVDGGGTRASGRVEVAQGRHRSTFRGGLERVAGDLAVRLAAGVGHVADEADVVGDVEVRVDEQRAALQRRQQVHLLRGAAAVVEVLVVELAGAQSGAATVRSLPCTGAAGATPVAPLADDRVGAAVTDTRVGVQAEEAVLGPDGLFLVVLGTDGDRAAIAGEADQEVSALLLAVALAVLAGVEVGFSTVEVLAGDDVDHAGHGVGAVDRRSAVLQHVDAFDGDGRDGRDVLEAIRRNAQTLAVDQHQRTLRAQVAQVDVRTAGFLVGGQRRRAAERRAAGGRDVLQDVGDRAEALVLDVSTGDGQDRLSSFHVNLADARTGDRDAVQVGGASGFLSDGATGAGGAGDQREDDGVAQFVAVAVHWALSPS